MNNFNIKRLLAIAAFGIFIITSTFGPMTASAQVYNQNYKPKSLSDLIAYLYGVIASLEAQNTGAVINSNQSFNTNVNRADVETLSATSIKKNGATVRSDIEFGSAKYVYAYFEYGTKKSVDESTNEKKINKSSNYTHTILLDDLKTNTTYYYRAVIELPGGSKVYGELRNFTTGKTTNSNANNSSNNKDISTDDSEYNQGDNITVSYEFSLARQSGSWIGLFKEGASNNQYIAWKSVSEDDGEIDFTAPYQTGEFEFRLFSDSGYNRVAVSDSFEVNK